MPKGLGMIHRKDDVDQIKVCGLNLDGIHLEAFAISVHRARYVTKIILKDCGLTDKEGISIISQMNKSLVKHLDVSENSTLSPKFYDELGKLMKDENAVLDRIELEDNRISDQTLESFINDLIEGGRISYLNVSKNGITDTGARSLAKLIRECPHLRLLFLHYNKILGMGGIEIAEAIEHSKSLQVLDISFNSITGTGMKIMKEERSDGEKTPTKKPVKKKKPKKLDKDKPATVGFAELFA